MNTYEHSVYLDADKCNGCTTCLKHCPTEAIRIRDGKAVINQERCIDCGECIRVCPYKAKNPLLKTGVGSARRACALAQQEQFTAKSRRA